LSQLTQKQNKSGKKYRFSSMPKPWGFLDSALKYTLQTIAAFWAWLFRLMKYYSSNRKRNADAADCADTRGLGEARLNISGVGVLIQTGQSHPCESASSAQSVFYVVCTCGYFGIGRIERIMI
jgi:hypothetical protein